MSVRIIPPVNILDKSVNVDGLSCEGAYSFNIVAILGADAVN